MAHKHQYEEKQGLLVLSADRVGGLVAPNVLINHVPATHIYGDGKVVFIDPREGSGTIYEGKLSPNRIDALFGLLAAKGFWGWEESYHDASGPADMPTSVLFAQRRDGTRKSVSCYGPGSAPAGFNECFQQLLFPDLKPDDVVSYVREPITEGELEEGWYWGFEYQKKFDTPASWVWLDAGRSSKWHKPEVHPGADVTLDSSYINPTVNGCHHVVVHYRGHGPGGDSSIQFDRNLMSPNEYGDIGMTTLMYCAPKAASLTLLKEEPDKHLFDVSVAGYSGPRLHLVIEGDLDHPTEGRLITLDDGEGLQNIYHLHVR